MTTWSSAATTISWVSTGLDSMSRTRTVWVPAGRFLASAFELVSVSMWMPLTWTWTGVESRKTISAACAVESHQTMAPPSSPGNPPLGGGQGQSPSTIMLGSPQSTQPSGTQLPNMWHCEGSEGGAAHLMLGGHAPSGGKQPTGSWG